MLCRCDTGQKAQEKARAPMTLLDQDAFLTRFAKALEESRSSGTVYVTFKRCTFAALECCPILCRCSKGTAAMSIPVLTLIYCLVRCAQVWMVKSRTRALTRQIIAASLGQLAPSRKYLP